MLKNNKALTIAAVGFDIRATREIDDSALPVAYSEFRGDGERDVSVAVDLLEGAKTGLSKIECTFTGGDMWSLFRDGNVRYLTHTGFGIDAPMWCAEFDLDLSEIKIHCGDILLGRGERIATPVRYPLDQLLMTYVLARRQGFLLHTAGVLVGGSLWLLCGKSGAGKSTISGLLRGRDDVELLSDDRIMVRVMKNEVIGYGTPWPGEAKIASNKKAPLAGIMFLEQSLVNQIDEIAPLDAFERMMPVVSVPWYEKELFPSVLECCGLVAERVPMFRMRFRPDEAAVEMVMARIQDV